MHLARLRVHNFRCIASADIEPSAGLNLIIGANASGKTSLLEAIHFLGRAQSFRGTPVDRLIRFSQARMGVAAEIRNGGVDTAAQVERAGGTTRVRLGADENPGLLQLAERLPLQVVDPRLHQLLEEGPEERRRFLDWGVFHVEHGFYPAWRRYRRALRQRNESLRAAASDTEVLAWDAELQDQATAVDAMRRRYLEALAGPLAAIGAALFDEAAIEVEYYAGWREGESLLEVLASGLPRDRDAGHTQHGPHRADLRISLRGHRARTHASRGEQKLLSAALLLAQAQLLQARRGHLPVLLIDDLVAELDARSREAVFRAVAGLGAQCFLSFLERPLMPDSAADPRMFHVEHGRITPAN